MMWERLFRVAPNLGFKIKIKLFYGSLLKEFTDSEFKINWIKLLLYESKLPEGAMAQFRDVPGSKILSALFCTILLLFMLLKYRDIPNVI